MLDDVTVDEAPTLLSVDTTTNIFPVMVEVVRSALPQFAVTGQEVRVRLVAQLDGRTFRVRWLPLMDAITPDNDSYWKYGYPLSDEQVARRYFPELRRYTFLG